MSENQDNQTYKKFLIAGVVGLGTLFGIGLFLSFFDEETNEIEEKPEQIEEETNETQIKEALNYSFLPKNKLLASHVDECINLLDKMHKSNKSVDSPLLLWRTLFKYQNYFTPSANSENYTPYTFPGSNFVYLSCNVT
jgi:hypothetical protein